MLEADIVMGTIVGKDGPPMPIMAHPPATTSDLSLAEFLETISQHNVKETNPASKKGAKLDFKSIEAFEQSQELISKYQVRVIFFLLACIFSLLFKSLPPLLPLLLNSHVEYVRVLVVVEYVLLIPPSP